MARGGAKQELHDTTEAKTTGKAKKEEAPGCWPCKINGCNKQFAREADLKRHQRTTKTHSMPAYCCSHCDATFTRADALKRHAQSRHSGPAYESAATNTSSEADGQDSSESTSLMSSDNNPDSKDYLRPGPLKYYRPHTMIDSSQSSPQADESQETSLPSPTTLRIPAIITRDCAQTPTSNQHKYYSPYYRRNSVSARPSTRVSKSTQQRRRTSLPATKITSTPRRDRPPDPPPKNCPHRDEGPNTDTDPITQPLLDFVLGDPGSTSLTEEQVIQITQTAINAVLEAEAERLRLEGMDNTPIVDSSERKTVNPGETVHDIQPYDDLAGQDILHIAEGRTAMLDPGDILSRTSFPSPSL